MASLAAKVMRSRRRTLNLIGETQFERGRTDTTIMNRNGHRWTPCTQHGSNEKRPCPCNAYRSPYWVLSTGHEMGSVDFSKCFSEIIIGLDPLLPTSGYMYVNCSGLDYSIRLHPTSPINRAFRVDYSPASASGSGIPASGSGSTPISLTGPSSCPSVHEAVKEPPLAHKPGEDT